MNRSQFDKQVLAMARAEHPDYGWRLVGGRLECQPPTGPSTPVDLANEYAHAPRNANVRRWISERLALLVQIIGELAYGDWIVEKDNVYPLMKPAALLIDSARKRERGEEGAAACTFAWYSQLCVSCVLDRSTAMVHLGQDHLSAWGKTAEEVFEQAKTNLLQAAQELRLEVHELAGFTVVHVEPTPYTATYAILPAFRLALGAILGSRFRIVLPGAEVLAAYRPKGAAFNLAHEDELARDLIGAIASFKDAIHPLPYTGHLAIDLRAGTEVWEDWKLPSETLGPSWHAIGPSSRPN